MALYPFALSVSPCQSRALVRLAAPIALTNVAGQAMSLTDTLILGRVDAVALGGMSLGATAYFVAATLAAAFVFGVEPIAAQALGAGRERLARRALRQGLLGAVLVVLPTVGLSVLLAHGLELIGIAGDLAASARGYVFGRLPSTVLLMASIALRSFLQASHLVRPVLVAVASGSVVNAVAGMALVHGAGLGAGGIGLANSLAYVVIVAIMLLAAGSGEPGLDGGLLRRLGGLGLPLSLAMLAEMGVFSLAGLLMGRMGPAAIAAHPVAMVPSAMTFVVATAVGSAAAVQVGRAVGRGDGVAARRAGTAALGLGGAFMVVAGIVLWLAPERVAGLLVTDVETRRIAASLLRVVGAFQLFDGLQGVATGALRGAGITAFTFGANLVSYWLVGLPVAVALAFGLGLGPVGLYVGLTAGLGLAAALLVGRFVVASRRGIRPVV